MCWAVDVGYKHGLYHFFFSNGGSNFGVMKAGDPTLSDAVDELHAPLVTAASVDNATHPYDPTVLIDDDPAQTAYIAFGLHEPGALKPSARLVILLSPPSLPYNPLSFQQVFQ